MVQVTRSALLGILGLTLTAATAFAADPVARRDEVVILRKPGGKQASALGFAARAISGSSVETISLPRTQTRAASTAPDTADLSPMLEACERLKSEGVAAKCSPNFRYHSSAVPNDSYFSSLYGMSRIQAPAAWDITAGSSGVVVAVVDSGIQWTHPDLAPNAWWNPGEYPDNGIDDNGDGKIDDAHGFDWVNWDGDPMDDNGHGTHCAGTIGGRGSNGYGVVGVSQVVSLMGLKVLDSEGSGYTSDISAGVEYAGLHGAHVISMSLGGPGYDEVFEEVIRVAGLRGSLVVVAAGNESTNNDATPSYPASYNLFNLITVAATDSNDALADFSNYGTGSVHIAAPGVQILSTYPGDGFEVLDGTSMATPHVAGAAALIKAANPGLTVTQLRAFVLDFADQIGALSSSVQGGRRLNVYSSLAAAVGLSPTNPTPTDPTDPDPRTDVEADSLYIEQERIGARKYDIYTVAYRASDEAAAPNTPVVVSCKESGGKKRTYRKSGTTDEYGEFYATIRFTGSKTTCTARTESGLRSNRLSFRIRR